MAIDCALSESDLIADLCRERFSKFVKEFWEVINPETNLDWSWHMDVLCNELQRMAERVFQNEPKAYDLIINISPGTSKSTIVTQMFPAWTWTRMKSARTIAASYEEKLALDHAVKNRRVVQSEKYRAAFPEIGDLRYDQNVKSHFENDFGGARYAAGVGGAVTGRHAHFLLVDDPLNPKKAASKTELENAEKWMRETLPTRKVNKEVTPTILVMQRLHEDDPSGHLLKMAGESYPIKHICLPAELTDKVRPKKLRRLYVNGLMDPKRLGPKVLAEMKKLLGTYGYAGQFLQNPVPPEGGQFKVAKLKFGTPPPVKTFLIRCRAWDKAGTEKGGDWTVGVLVGQDDQGRFWILDVHRGQWDTFEVEQHIKTMAERDGKDVVIHIPQDPGAAGKKSALDTVKMLAGWIVEYAVVSGSKQERARPFSSQVNGENVWIPTGAEWIPDLLDELKYFPLGTNDDQVDAASDAFNICSEGVTVVGGAER